MGAVLFVYPKCRKDRISCAWHCFCSSDCHLGPALRAHSPHIRKLHTFQN